MFVKIYAECNIITCLFYQQIDMPAWIFLPVFVAFFFLTVQSYHEFHNILMENLALA